ncbi:Pentatricopeptide repeat [Macleaya cordata]|uniref:Pentatricopeptide repeat n=1 Tax=Macleaya cordata TaxID=56857 RepID=A0A200QMV3_MACCD|nr:Pentatricopeptide repeat [Macleaya cordata]
MSERNEASWNTIISGCVGVGLYAEAFELFRKMLVQNIEPNIFVLSSLISACNKSASMVSQGIQIHGFVAKIGLLSDVFVSTALLHFYGTYGFMSNARRFFEEMPERNVVSWTSLMVGYSNNGDPEEAMKIYSRMRREGISCNQNSFATVISSCGSLEDELLGRQVLAHVVVSGLESNVSVANSLISMFGSFGDVENAKCVFYRMGERDIISWNSIISAYSQNGICEESLRIFQKMRRANVKPNSTTLSSLVSACSSVDNLKWGTGIHGLVVKLGLDSIVCICNTLVTLYSESGRFENSELLFLEMPERDLISWNSMLASYVQNGQCREALELLAELLRMSKIRSHVTFASAMAACSSPETLLEGKTVHALIIRAGFHENLLMGNSLITMYGKCGVMGAAERAFHTMAARDGVTWNALIGGFVENEEPREAMKAFKSMRENGLSANYITLVNILGSCSAPNDLLTYGMPIHASIVHTGFERDDYVKNSLLTMYAKCGDLASSNFIFAGFANKNAVSWNAMIAANAHHGSGEEALKLFVEMHRSGLGFDHFSFSGGLAASSNLAILEEGQQLHNLIIKLGFDSDLHVTNAAMDMYGKCGEMVDVLKILPEPSNRSRLSWNILISGFSRHGFFKEALETFHEMLQVGIKPDHVTFVSLLSACNHGGLIDEGLAYFSSMTSEFGVTPGIEHCVCIIDLLGRSGRLGEAEKFITEMPIPPNDLVWRSLLSACRNHNNLELGKKAAERLLELDPSDDAAYVLLSNVCAINGRWDDVETVRKKMKSNNIRKKPACSWVKVKNKVTSFGMGDRSHAQTEQIYMKLKDLMKMIKQAGYVPDTSFALHDTDEEQKEHNLWNHSEKIALAFGLINSVEGSTIRVFKNLRVCGDCHSVYKHVSEAVRRDIVLRDPYRFHHFSRGKCSCGDYW